MLSICRVQWTADSRDRHRLLGVLVRTTHTHSSYVYTFPPPLIDSCLHSLSLSFRCPTWRFCSQTSVLQLLQRHAGKRSPDQGAETGWTPETHLFDTSNVETTRNDGMGVLQEGQTRPGASLVFCSPNCSSLYSSDLRRTAGTKV